AASLGRRLRVFTLFPYATLFRSSPETGFDCSGFTQYVFARHGVRLPRTARDQAMVGTSLGRDWDALQPGDLVMFSDDGDMEHISHVAIFAGGNKIIHSTASGGG